MTATDRPIDVDPPPQPVPDPDSAGFWQATADGRLAIRRCQACGWWSQPPLERCRYCAAVMAYEEVSGEGTLYSFIVVHQPAVPGFGEELPYLIGLVDLAEQEGLRLVARLEDVDADELRVGLPVRARIVAHPGGGFHVPLFSPVRRRSSATAAEHHLGGA
jgi:uncharacterized OB-fold protein